MPKKTRIAIYEHLFKEGVMVAKKDFHAPKHPELDVPNLHVIKALQVKYMSLRFGVVKFMVSLPIMTDGLVDVFTIKLKILNSITDVH